jgi:hypothetical protein
VRRHSFRRRFRPTATHTLALGLMGSYAWLHGRCHAHPLRH